MCTKYCYHFTNILSTHLLSKNQIQILIFIVNNHLNFIGVLLSEKLKIGFSQKGLKRFFWNSGFKKKIIAEDKMLVNSSSPNYSFTYVYLNLSWLFSKLEWVLGLTLNLFVFRKHGTNWINRTNFQCLLYST